MRTAVDNGWHCLCEKPFLFPSAEGRRLVGLADERGLVLAVVHNFQFSRAGDRLFALIDRGSLGEVRALYGFQLSNPERRLPHWHSALPGGLFLDEAPHLLYLTRRILGRLDPRTIDARTRGREIEQLTMTFEHPAIAATIAMSFDAAISEWTLTVVGSRATAVLDVFRDSLVVLPNDGRHRAREIARTSALLLAGHARGAAATGLALARRRLLYGNDRVVRAFVDAVLGDRQGLVGMAGTDGVAIVECLEIVLSRVGLDQSPPA